MFSSRTVRPPTSDVVSFERHAPRRPAVTVLMPNFNCAAFLASSLRSVLASTLEDIEVVVVDDASNDASVAVISAVAETDRRVRLFRSAVNGGPAVARNIGLDHARGRWIAVVDSDDLIHPDRLARMVALAEADGVQMACDNLLVFDDQDQARPHAFLKPGMPARDVGVAEYVRANAFGRGALPLGYLKPLFDAEFIRAAGIRYRPELRVAQDFGFVLDLLVSGARMRLYPGVEYLYRKHPMSNSHRLKRRNVEAMIEGDDAVAAGIVPMPPDLADAFAARRRGFQRALAFDTLVTQVKGRDWLGAAGTGLRHPRAALMLSLPVRARAGRAWRRLRVAGLERRASTRPCLCIVSYRRSGFASLGQFARQARRAGYAVHLLLPSPWGAAERVDAAWRQDFDSVLVRSGSDDSPEAEAVFLARHGRRLADVVLLDGERASAMSPYLLRPDAPRLKQPDRYLAENALRALAELRPGPFAPVPAAPTPVAGRPVPVIG